MADNNQQDRRKPLPEIAAIKARLDEGDRRMKALEDNLIANTQATEQIAQNTIGLVRLTNELEAGTRFLCRCAMAVKFILDAVKKYTMPVMSLSILGYLITHNLTLPSWFISLAKVFI